MLRPLLLIILTICLQKAVLCFENLDQSLEFRTGGTVRLEHRTGNIRIEVWAEELLHLTLKKAHGQVSMSDLSIINTKNQIQIKTSDSSLDLVVYIPRQTNLRITSQGNVTIRGAIASAHIETQGEVRIEAPASQDADLVLTTRNGVIRSSLHVDTYGQATLKQLQGKLGNGGNPIIVRTVDGNINLSLITQELDQDIATIPALDPQQPSNYQTSPSTPPPTPYSYGGSYGGSNTTDIFSNNRDTDDSTQGTSLGSRHREKKDDSLGFGVKIIPPHTSTRTPDTIYHDSPKTDRNDSIRSSTKNDSLFKTAPDLQGTDDDGVIKIDTKLVTLNASVTDRSGKAVANLKQEQFHVYEDGVEQAISHFEPVNTPFNLILLIDLSGSIIDKIDILRRSAIRFIEVTRPEDKVAIITFTRSVQVVSELTNDRQLLKQRLQYMHMPKGGTALYEALWFTTSQIVQPVEGERTAIVLLTDGVDNSISINYPLPSRVSFDQVYRKLQESSALVFPIYLDTEHEVVSQQIEDPGSYVTARRQLQALAEATGGLYIKADRVESLEGVYEKIASDLRTLYSLGYYPTNPQKDGTWRKIRVKVDQPEVSVRTRKGYYAN